MKAPKPIRALDAIRRAGGVSYVSRALGITRQAIYKWEVVPATRCMEIEELGGPSCYEMRPDVFPAPVRATRRQAS